MAMAAGEAFGGTTAPSPAPVQDVQAAIAKAVELRAIHAALRQRGAPNAGAGASTSASRSPAAAIIRLPPAAASPARSRAAAADEDYPVFTPTHDEEPTMAGLNDICQENRSRSEKWSCIALDRDGRGFTASLPPTARHTTSLLPAIITSGAEAAYSDYDNLHGFSSSNSEAHYFPPSSDHHLRSRGAYRIHPAFLQSAPLAGRFPASAGRATSTAELKVPASCGSAFRPATIGRDHGGGIDMGGLRFLSSSRVPLSSHQPSAHSRAKHLGSQIVSWLFAKAKKKAKPETMSPPATTNIERDNMSQLLKEWGLLSLDSLKRDLTEANAHRDAALRDAAEMRSSLGELTTKLLSLEEYCSELKKAVSLRQETTNNGGGTPSHSRQSTTRSIGASRELLPTMPVSHEAMVEGFLQIASEARLAVKQLCKALIQQVEEPDNGLSDKLNLLLQPYQLMITDDSDRHCSRVVLYHLEALMNRSMYQDFENCTFQKNGSPKHLDPKQEREESFASFVALRNLSWNEVLRKGTRYYSEELSRFCDQKMSCVVATLNWSWPWPEQLLQCFFVATKCVWLLHLLAFSFSPPLPILRVEENRAFDQMYMEDILLDKKRVENLRRVKIMVMPGFYVQDRVLKARVLTTRSVA